MIIKNLSLKAANYKMVNKLKSSNFTHNIRNSWIIKIEDNDGFIGYGEASPLPSFNRESFEEAGYCLEGFKLAIRDINEPISIEELIILSNVHTLTAPSATFAIQTALYDLLSTKNNQSLSNFINSNSLSSVQSNGIYNLTSINNYKVIKLKCGFRNLYDEIELLESLSTKYSNVRFIIDLNQAYDLPKAIRFFKEISKFRIEYIEQPIEKNNFEDLIELSFHSEIPIALDESIKSLKSINKALSINCGDVFIIKPQSIGSFANIKKAISLVREGGKIPIITSSLEGSIGRLATMHVVSANLIKNNCGLLMEPIYYGEEEVIPKINNGILDIPNKVGLGYYK